MNIFTNVNRKIICVERHIRTEVNRLFPIFLLNDVFLNKTYIYFTLTLATQSPDEFTYNLMTGPRYHICQ